MQVPKDLLNLAATFLKGGVNSINGPCRSDLIDSLANLDNDSFSAIVQCLSTIEKVASK